MKKLMTVLATAATALFAASAVADNVVFSESAENFESLTAGKAFDSNNGMTNGFWQTDATADEMTVSNHVGAVSCPRPDKWNGAANNNYLQLDVSTPLSRGLKEINGGEFPGVEIGDGIYLDTLVKFTAADEPFSTDLTDGDKIAIEYVDQTTDETIVNPIKGFVIRAGQTVGENFVQTNYFAAAPANFDVSAWHRLTVRSIANVDDGHQVGFVIYLDGNVNPLAYSTDVDAGFGTLDPAVAEKFYNANLHALYPSAVNSGDNKGVISAAAFSGTGGIDDVVITRDVPNFIASGEGVVVPFTVDAGVAAISVQVGDADPIVVDMTAQSLSATLPSGTSAFTVTATVDEANGYTFVSMTVGDAVYSVNPASVEGYAGGAITITTTRNNFTYLDENDQEQTAGTLTDAFAGVKVGGTITMNYTYNLSDYEGLPTQGTTVFSLTKSCVLDLNGKTLNGGSSNDFYLFTPGYDCEFTVIDSATGGKIIYGGTKGIFNGNLGDVFIGSITLTDNGPTIDGSLMGAEGYVTSVWRGKFSADENTEAGKFIATLGDVQKCKAELDANNEYWVVTYDSGEEPGEDTVIAVPTAASNLVYDGTEQTGVAAGTGYTLTGTAAATDAGDYTATATLSEGYVWEGGSKEAQTINWSIAKAEVTATVSLTETSATYDSEKTVVTDYTTPSVSFGLGAPELVEDTDYTVAWSATEVTGAGTFTYTVSPVAGSNYTFTEASATLTITEGGEYPSYIPAADDAAKAKYDTWKETYGADTASVYEDAFLLNIAPDAVDQTLEPESITIENGKVVITANRDLESVNGKVYIKTAGTLADLADALWAEATLDEDGAIEMTPNGTSTAAFFKIKVDF